MFAIRCPVPAVASVDGNLREAAVQLLFFCSRFLRAKQAAIRCLSELGTLLIKARRNCELNG